MNDEMSRGRDEEETMKASRVVLAAVLALFAAAALFATGSPEPGPQAGPQAAQPYPLTFLTSGDVAARPLKPDDRIVAELNKRLGIELTVKAVPQNAWDRINVTVAAGDLPDVVTMNYPSASVNQWLADAILLPLNDHFGVAPTVKKHLEEMFKWTAVGGKYYGYVQPGTGYNYDLCYRSDWLKKLNLKPAATLDEFREIMRAFTLKDPDGNGKNDSYGLTGEKNLVGASPQIRNNFLFVFFAYGLKWGDYTLDAKGTVAPYFEDPAFALGMKYLKGLWDEKLIEPEFILNDMTLKEQKFAQGKAGAMTTWLFRNLNRVETLVKNVTPEGGIAFADGPKGPTGTFGVLVSPKGGGGVLTAVTKACKQPAKGAALIEFLVASGRDLLEKGIEGIHYTKDAAGKIVYNEPERAKDNFAPNGWAHPLAWGHVAWPLTNLYLPDTEPQRERAIESVVVSKRNQKPNLVPVVAPLEIELETTLTDIHNQYFLDILFGKIGVDEGIAELSKKWRSQGGDRMLAQVNELYQKVK